VTFSDGKAPSVDYENSRAESRGVQSKQMSFSFRLAADFQSHQLLAQALNYLINFVTFVRMQTYQSLLSRFQDYLPQGEIPWKQLNASFYCNSLYLNGLAMSQLEKKREWKALREAATNTLRGLELLHMPDYQMEFPLPDLPDTISLKACANHYLKEATTFLTE
jgi:hypothetical protein